MLCTDHLCSSRETRMVWYGAHFTDKGNGSPQAQRRSPGRALLAGTRAGSPSDTAGSVGCIPGRWVATVPCSPLACQPTAAPACHWGLTWQVGRQRRGTSSATQLPNQLSGPVGRGQCLKLHSYPHPGGNQGLWCHFVADKQKPRAQEEPVKL